MLKNYMTVALRYIKRYKGYSIINIAGLGIGMAVCLLIMLWVGDETAYDRFHTQADRIHLVYRTVTQEATQWSDDALSGPGGPKILEEVPEVEAMARYHRAELRLERDNDSWHGQGAWVDPEFLSIFTFPLISGDMKTALSTPNSIVITQTMAQRIFGEENPIGQPVGNDLTVTGVLADTPVQSHIRFEFLAPISAGERIEQLGSDEWYRFGYSTYVLLHKGASASSVGQKIEKLYQRYDPEFSLVLKLVPLTDYYLKGLDGDGRMVYVYIFSVIALLVLVVACTNYMNLATARSDRRAKEIGLRKTVGATRIQLALQMLAEAVLTSTVALGLAIIAVELALPAFNDLAGKQLSLEFTGHTVGLMAVITIMTGLLSGVYPALYLSRMRPALVLKGSKGTGSGVQTAFFRRALVVGQFALSTGLILGALVVHNQLDFMRSKDLGIDRDNIVCVPVSNLDQDYRVLTDEFTRHPNVLAATATFQPPSSCWWSISGPEFEGMSEDQEIRVGIAWVEEGYADVFGLDLTAGRYYSEEMSTDMEQAVVINEAAAELMGMDDPIGKSFTYDEPRTIVGVVKDFHVASLREEITPLVLMPGANFRYLCLKVSPEDITSTLAFIESKFGELRPGEQYSYHFFRDLLDRNYRAEQRMGTIVTAFTLLAVVVCVLGLFGLAAHTADKRTREIAIRKILGAPTMNVMRLLSTEIALLVLLANVLIWPLAWYVSDLWLDNFAYRIGLDWSIFALAGGATMFVALATVSFQLGRAARTNPVTALRHE